MGHNLSILPAGRERDRHLTWAMRILLVALVLLAVAVVASLLAGYVFVA